MTKETLIKDMSPDTPMDLVCGTGKKRRNTGSISSIFAEAMRQIGGVYGGRAMNQRFPNRLLATNYIFSGALLILDVFGIIIGQKRRDAGRFAL
jgi:hypothetical protein